MQPGLNASFFFMSVQAITSNFAASLMRIFVPTPFSFSRPLGIVGDALYILIPEK